MTSSQRTTETTSPAHLAAAAQEVSLLCVSGGQGGVRSSSTLHSLSRARPLTCALSCPPVVAAVLLFVSSAAWTLTNLRDELGDILAGDEDTLGDLTLMGLGLGECADMGWWWWWWGCMRTVTQADMQHLGSVLRQSQSSQLIKLPPSPSLLPPCCR
jgi:hypothetical protein